MLLAEVLFCCLFYISILLIRLLKTQEEESKILYTVLVCLQSIHFASLSINFARAKPVRCAINFCDKQKKKKDKVLGVASRLSWKA